MRFLKMHGLGNDFVVLDLRTEGAKITPETAQKIGDRHFGVGFDQLAVIEPSLEADARLVFWNSDGSTSGACGNATRCVMRILMEESGKNTARLQTGAGFLTGEKTKAGVRVNMGQPFLNWKDVPLAEDVDMVNLPIEGAPSAVGMGNPHCSFFVNDLDKINWQNRGAEIEHHPLFPERTNVQFAQVIDRETIRVKVWERGVGVTLASGSSACAVAVGAYRKGLTERKVTIKLDGGTLIIEWREDGIYMEGPASKVFEGQFFPEFLDL